MVKGIIILHICLKKKKIEKKRCKIKKMRQNESFMKQPFHLHLYWFYLKSAQVIMHVFLIAKKAT